MPLIWLNYRFRCIASHIDLKAGNSGLIRLCKQQSVTEISLSFSFHFNLLLTQNRYLPLTQSWIVLKWHSFIKSTQEKIKQSESRINAGELVSTVPFFWIKNTRVHFGLSLVSNKLNNEQFKFDLTFNTHTY